MSDVILEIMVEPNSTSVPIYRYVPIPPGGAIRQVLTKSSSADFDMGWADVVGGDSTITLIAGVTLSALKLVYEIDGIIYPLSHTDSEDLIDTLTGITLTAGNSGQPITVARSGYVEDSGWSWSRGRVYLGVNGSMTQTPPTTGASLMVGRAVSATKVLIDFSEAIFI